MDIKPERIAELLRVIADAVETASPEDIAKIVNTLKQRELGPQKSIVSSRTKSLTAGQELQAEEVLSRLEGAGTRMMVCRFFRRRF